MPRRLKQVTLAAGAAAGAAAGTAKPATRRKGRVLPVQWLILSNRRGCHMVPRMTQRNWERTKIGDGTSIFLSQSKDGTKKRILQNEVSQTDKCGIYELANHLKHASQWQG
jgi:hypothetical protein